MRALRFVFLSLVLSGCMTLFGWDIHAPGILSENYFQNVDTLHQRMGLYYAPELIQYESTNKGGKLADPQRYHIGEALAPMLIEGFQQGFDEFIFFEEVPTPDLMKQYGIPYLAVVRPKSFANDVTMKGQAVMLTTETVVLDPSLNILARFESKGSSDARKVFAKKGGPEVNLNSAVENNIQAIVQYIQDAVRTGNWQR